MKELRIVFLHNEFRVYWKGRLYYLRNYLSDHGISLKVIEIFGQSSAYSFDKAVCHENWWECLFPDDKINGLNTRTVKKKIHSRLDEIQPDVIIAGAIAFTSGAIGLQWAKRNKKKIIIFDDAKHSFYRRTLLTRFVKQTLTLQGDAFLIPSHDYDEEYLNWGVDKKDLYYGLSCINNKYYHKKERGYSKENYRTIICVARLVPIKNIKGLLYSWQNIQKKFSNYRLVIVGDGPQYQQLRQIVKELSLTSVHLLGALNPKNIAKIYSESEAFILPSFHEGWGFVVNEAMASGLPVLLSNRINAGTSLLKEGYNGFFFDPNHINEISDAIIKYINTPPVKKIEMSKNARLAIRKYNYRFLGNELLRAISDLSIKPYKQTNMLIGLAINFWNGKFVTSNWNYLK